MNTQTISTVDTSTDQQHNASPFIEANTQEVTLAEIEMNHTIPVFLKDNESLISHPEFIDLTIGIVHHAFSGETILEPNIRVSHPIMGRIPEAKHKAAKDLKDHETTIYYERMAFVIQIPTISKQVNGNTLTLTIGGIKAYNQDNIYRCKGAPEHFKVFVGFLNKVCTNMCVWNEGFCKTLKVSTSRQLESAIFEMVRDFCNSGYYSHFNYWDHLSDVELSEDQFAHLLGRAKLYQYLPNKMKANIPELLLNDTQVSAIAKEFYSNPNFGNPEGGAINLWKLYNLFTGATKSTYIDSFLEKGMNASAFIHQLTHALEEKEDFWFLN